MGGDQLFAMLSNFNMLERILPSIASGRTIQDVGKDEWMQKLLDAGAIMGETPDKKLN